MKTFTFMSAEAVDALVKAIENDAETLHQFTFNRADFRELIIVLSNAYAELETDDEKSDDWAGQFVSGVAITYGIEMI